MTANQIKNLERKERERSNKAVEKETERSNRARETEAAKSRRQQAVIGGLNAASNVLTGVAKLNDPEWYNHNPQVTNDVASIPIQPLGSSTVSAHDYHTSVAGIMGLDVVCTPGISHDKGSAVNIAARNLYSWVRHMNSGSANYEAEDLMLYIIAIDNAYAFHAELRRLYGVMMNYSANNRYVGRHLVEALGYDFNNMASNLAGLRGYINMYAKRLTALKAPSNIDLFRKHYSLFSNILADADDGVDQIYVYRPDAFYTYDESTTGKLKWTAYGNGNSTVKKYKDLAWVVEFGNKLITNLTYSEDINIMSGDINKAFEQCFELPDVPEDYRVEPVHEVLNLVQFANSTYWLKRKNSAFDSFDIEQSADTGITFDPTLTGAGTDAFLLHYLEIYPSDKQIVRFYDVEGTPKETMEIMAHMLCTETLKDESTTTSVRALGGGVVFIAKMWLCNIDAVTGDTLTTQFTGEDGGPSNSTIAMLMNFYYAPLVLAISGNDTKPYIYLGARSRDAIVDANTVKQVGDAACLSLFNVPYGK